jgi:hypothetical protein
MSRTDKEFKLRLKRQIGRQWNLRSRELGLGVNGKDVNPEVAELAKKMDELHVDLGRYNWDKEERRHSAAHRHSAIKTGKRCRRGKKRSEKAKAIKQAKEDT